MRTCVSKSKNKIHAYIIIYINTTYIYFRRVAGVLIGFLCIFYFSCCDLILQHVYNYMCRITRARIFFLHSCQLYTNIMCLFKTRLRTYHVVNFIYSFVSKNLYRGVVIHIISYAYGNL